MLIQYVGKGAKAQGELLQTVGIVHRFLPVG
jgi:hypothetical protein